ncbi:DUF1934 domain-containing protein [Anaerocolumna aminovalerica]|uniref:DUF1934 domain-containing protein n=1 Tax=Anaerocolumna aminovalerica TaxID=1527 RepID=UPI000BE2D68C|nr:DUF1934 domain-containing protein [Anaerocolumna aminovalerica]
MKKDVLVSISGLQFEIDKEEAVEIISAGEYYNRNGKHYILYDEILEEMEGITNCTLKISHEQVSIQKKGANNVHMIFEVNRKNLTYYSTPFGDLQIGINTTSIKVTEEKDQILVNIQYELDINYSHVSDCEIQVKITSRGTGK